jgi:mannose-6-phosphate isomerase-like protein (cupin superfamily)
MKIVLSAAVPLLLAFSLSAQTAPSGAPHKPAAVFPTADLHQQIEKLIPAAKKQGSSGATIADYGSYKIQLSVRTTSGGAEVHAHWDDVMIVEKGSATLITGGTVANSETDSGGETHGSKIENGASRRISPGDVITVHAGTPHQLILAPGIAYGAVVVKVHEP